MRKVKLVLFQLIAMFFIVSAVRKIWFATYSDELECLLKFTKDNEVDCWDESKYGNISIFMNDIQFFTLYVSLAFVFAILILNMALRFSWKTTITVFVGSVFLVRIIQTDLANLVLNSFGGIFFENRLYKYIIESLTYAIIGIVFLMLSVKIGKEGQKIDRDRKIKKLV